MPSKSEPLMPGDVMPTFSCSVVKSNMDITAWSTSELKSSYAVFFFFPMISAVDASEIGALRVRDYREGVMEINY